MREVHKTKTISIILAIITVFFGFVLTNSFASAEGKGGDDDISCTFSYTAGDDHTVSVLSGSYTTNIGTTDFTTKCNDDNGFAIYTVGNTNDEHGNNKMSATIGGSLAPDYDILTGTNTSGANSSWAIKLTATPGQYSPTIENGFDEYSNIPDEYTKAVSFTSSTDSTVGSSIRTNYAIFVSVTQPAGTYTGKVKYTLVNPHPEQPCAGDHICYMPNANDVVGVMGSQSLLGDSILFGRKLDLRVSNYSREGYGFAGWNTKPDGTGTSYGPNETITLPDNMPEGLYLYAMWVAPAKDSHGNSMTFQTANLLTTTLQDGTTLMDKPNGYVTALIDERDNDVYTVAKLADGNYWMIENLRLDYDADFTESLSQGFGKSANYGTFVGLAEPETQGYGNTTFSNSIYYAITPTSTSTVNIGRALYTYRMPRYNNANTANRVSNLIAHSQRAYGYGNYYTWAAAMANTMPYNRPTEEDENGRTSESVGTSICPAGWRLPVGRNTGNGAMSGSFSYLDRKLGGSGDMDLGSSPLFRAFPNNFVYSGHYENKDVAYRGRMGSYWSATTRSDSQAYLLLLGGGLDPATMGEYKYHGASVRCMIPAVYWHNVEVNFDSGVESVTLNAGPYGHYTVETSGQIVRLADGINYNISATYATSVDGFSSWATTENGTLGSSSEEETTYVVNNTTTLTLASKESCPSGRICYRNSGADNATAATMQSVNDSATSANLRVPNFKKSGYGFAGWNTKIDGSGTTYGPNETIAFDPTAEEGLMLYPTWVASAGSLQDWTCPSERVMPIGTVTALTDERDGDTYAVAKLADGKCWMIENMRLDYEDTIGDENEALSQGYASGFTGLAEPETSTFANSTTPNSLYTTDTSATALNIITGDNLGSRFPRYRNDNTATTVAGAAAVASRRAYGYGNYYTYAAAIADTSDHTTSGESVTTSICPAGWRLPTGGTKDSKNDYWTLVVDGLNHGVTPTDSGDSIYDGEPDGVEVSMMVRKYPNNFVSAGLSEDGTAVHQRGAHGNYWSSAVSDEDEAIQFSFRETGVNPGVSPIYKYDGLSVRCVTEYAGIPGYDYMQDFAGLTSSEMNALKDSMEENKQYVIKDSRDNKTYYISKLADGNIWMTQNLDYDIVEGGEDIDSTNTDVPANWTDAGNLTDTRATDDPNWSFSYTNPESYDPGDVCWDGVITTDQFQTLTDHGETCDQSGNHYHIGNYYNWTAALAMSNSGSYNTSETDAEQSICPAGWTLPKGGSNGDSGSFAYLINEAGLTSGESGNIHTSPAYFTYGGTWQNNSGFVGYGGFYWSRTTKYNDYTAYSLNITPYIAAPGGSNERFTGYSVRCVARTPEPMTIGSLEYMQDFVDLTASEKTEVLDSMVQDQQYQLADKRDNKVYYISKLADGNVWMTQNLDFNIVDGGANINSTNTDVPNDWADGGSLVDTYTTDTWSYQDSSPRSYDPGDDCWNGTISTSSSTIYDGMVATCTDYHYHLGNYYNWTAAVAMADSSSYDTDNMDAGQSICPAGWTLPRSGSDTSSGSFNYLASQINLTSGESGNIHTSPIYIVYSGNRDGTRVNYVGFNAAYWSSMAYNFEGAYAFDFNSYDYLSPNGINSRDYGKSVRCIVRN